MINPQIWFLRTDKGSHPGIDDISPNNLFVYSEHGSCGNHRNIEIQEAKKIIFPELKISGKRLRELVVSIKDSLISSGDFAANDPGKAQCDLFISYWVAIMKIGDIIVVRNKSDTVYVCRVSGYISEEFFDLYGSFQRPVEIIHEINPSALSESESLRTFWHRTYGRRTLERNDKSEVNLALIRFLSENGIWI